MLMLHSELEESLSYANWRLTMLSPASLETFHPVGVRRRVASPRRFRDTFLRDDNLTLQLELRLTKYRRNDTWKCNDTQKVAKYKFC